MVCFQGAGVGWPHEKALPNPDTYNKVPYQEIDTGGNDGVGRDAFKTRSPDADADDNTIPNPGVERMEARKRIALVAHDNRKKDLLEWVDSHYEALIRHALFSTGTTGKYVRAALEKKLGAERIKTLELTRLKSGPLGGDQQLGAMIAEGKIDILIFLWDPMQPQPHDVDVKALLRISVLYNVPTACNRSTADFLISSPLLSSSYEPVFKDYASYIERSLSSV